MIIASHPANVLQFYLEYKEAEQNMTKIIYTWCMDVSTGTTTATGKVCELYGDEQNRLL